jgi:hypothetical protein
MGREAEKFLDGQVCGWSFETLRELYGLRFLAQAVLYRVRDPADGNSFSIDSITEIAPCSLTDQGLDPPIGGRSGSEWHP